ncbi:MULTISPECIES: hypothetical protein [unclassified Leeuwenhoekiella]|uniref:hypothetical protein n=1 Tax=unclassified Leeuwenhoekiella TaxID=2615029 RepID=UPI000C4755D9|nr:MULTISPECIES: hypothetical protein [unclassified Leeuwenhoekiella]MAW96470.1 hypothetical protein [Leeuwenhoekiella sp.]MBA81357.1 hypothetical protein [Leeuwenhoekiella sp.]|tara:strand:- start:2428 stop:2886 length:459 start_codon:yes stop_codon:yes gene_type:complete
MKKSTFLFLLFVSFNLSLIAQVFEYQTVTVIESIIPNGLGRSRMISTLESRNYKEFTSERSEEDDSRNKSDRSDIRLKNFEETKLLNFFNIGGIRFQNIAANDAVVTSKINAMAEEGWELAFVNSGVESYGGDGDENGIYVTRYIFKRAKQE